MDYSTTSCSISKKLNQKAIDQGRCKIIEGDVTKLPFDDESMDIVTAFETVYFWPEITTSFREIHRVLKSKGQFLICNEGSAKENPNIKKWSEMLDFPVYSGDELKEMLEVLGFSVTYSLDDKQQISLLAIKS